MAEGKERCPTCGSVKKNYRNHLCLPPGPRDPWHYAAAPMVEGGGMTAEEGQLGGPDYLSNLFRGKSAS